nr:hypothetical protein [Tanacetum cinerariifolium]
MALVDDENAAVGKESARNGEWVKIFIRNTKAIKFSKPLVDDINIAELERYPPNEYLHPYKPSQRLQVDRNVVQYIEPYEKTERIITEADASLVHDQVD